MRNVLAILMILIPAVVQADPAASSCQIIVESPSCVIQSGRKVCHIIRDCGSGTCVANQDGKSYIATCRHIFANAEKDWPKSRIVVVNNGRLFVAKPFSKAMNLDLAVVVIDGSIEPVELDIDDDNDTGSEVESIGFPGGQREIVRVKHQIVGVMGDGSLFTNQAVKSGTSGGGLFRRGRLRGVIWGADENPSNATSIDPNIRRNPRITTAIRSRHVFNILTQDGIRCRCSQRTRSVVVAPPVPPPPIDNPPVVVPPPPVDTVSKVGPRGPKGDPGEIGPQGPKGDKGDSLSPELIDRLNRRIDELEQKLSQLSSKTGPTGKDGRDGNNGKDGPPGTVTVILLDKNGNPEQTAKNVKSGSVVRLRQKEVEAKGSE